VRIRKQPPREAAVARADAAVADAIGDLLDAVLVTRQRVEQAWIPVRELETPDALVGFLRVQPWLALIDEIVRIGIEDARPAPADEPSDIFSDMED
jgi:hypothetical protein